MKKILCFSTHPFEKNYLAKWSEKLSLKIEFLESRLNLETVSLAKGASAICCWTSDDLSKEVLQKLNEYEVKIISLRTAGFSHLDLKEAKNLGFIVTRVPSYSPQAIAEHALGLLMCLNRKFFKAFQRIKDFNFTLDGLEGVTLYGKSVGVIGAGKIGESFARIMKGFGCKIYLYDPFPNEDLSIELDAKYVSLQELLENSDVISLHCPYNEKTKHIINSKTLEFMKKDAFLLNTGRGALIDTDALILKLKKKELRGVGLDVYEYEEDVFFQDHSIEGISDEKLLRLMGFPNVLITSHQAFFTKEALENISKISLSNIDMVFKNQCLETKNLVCS